MTEERKSRDWNWHPDLPIPVSGVFDWPPNPIRMARWLAKSWLTVSTTTAWLGLAFAVWYWASPTLDTVATLSWDWIASLYLRNALLVTAVAGGLHLFFYTLKAQKDRKRFDPRGFKSNDPSFVLGDQVRDNMFWTLGSGVATWTAYEAAYLWLVANGRLSTLTWGDDPVWFVLLFMFIPIWASMHFYWVHRLLHWKPLYRHVHALHHRNIVIGPWSGISMHPIEHLIYFSSVLIHFVLPTHPVHMVFHLFVMALNPPCSHSGYEGVEVRGRTRMALGDFFHQLHHRFFECNYGTAEMPWDKWFGSFHDGTPEATRRMRDRQRGRNRATRAGAKARSA